jgi:hypothetical protein
MNNLKIAVFIFFVAFISGQNAYSAGSSTVNKGVKIFKELIVEGERPEISSCLTQAIQSVRLNSYYKRIAWEPDMSVSAVLKEYQLSGASVKEIQLYALALIRDESLFHLDNWTKISIQCQQVNEARPTLSFTKLGVH